MQSFFHLFRFILFRLLPSTRNGVNFCRYRMSSNKYHFIFFCSYLGKSAFASPLPDSFYVTPVGQSSQRSLLVARSTVHRQHLASRIHQHSCIAYGFVDAFEATNFACDGDGEVLVQRAHCEYRQKSLVKVTRVNAVNLILIVFVTGFLLICFV